MVIKVSGKILTQKTGSAKMDREISSFIESIKLFNKVNSSSQRTIERIDRKLIREGIF